MKRILFYSMLVAALAFVVVATIGCVAASKIVTPARLDQSAIEYVAESQVAEPESYKSFLWPNLADAEKLERDVEKAYQCKKLYLEQALETEAMTYAQIKDTVVSNANSAAQLEELLFSQTGLLSMGLAALGVGGGWWLGLMRKRPGDVTSQDLAEAVATAREESAAGYTVPVKALEETVKGIEKFKESIGEQNAGAIKEMLGSYLANAQSSDTKALIGSIRATV